MFRLIFNLWARFRPYRTEWVEDLPVAPCKNTVYVIGGREHPFYAAIACPRKTCRQVIHLDVSPDVDKRWRITEHDNGRITLSPSIQVNGLPCRCHYWLRNGQVVWSDRPPLIVPRVNRNDP